LMPYIYNIAYESAKTGAPFVRPIFFNDTSDADLFKATDQYYFGSSLLVAPVLEKAAKKRKLYLPLGQWYNFWKPDAPINGGRWLEVDVTADQIPVYVRAGSVIPMKPVFRNTAGYPKEILEWHYYPKEGSHTSSIYEDDGVSAQAMRTNAYEIIRVHVRQGKNQHTIRFGSNGNKYPGKPASREVKWVMHGQPSAPSLVQIDGKAYNNYQFSNSILEITLNDWKDQSVLLKVE
ncbi:MAG: DUF5110 domain-containing protein, partial [Bacteroidota bacterium]